MHSRITRLSPLWILGGGSLLLASCSAETLPAGGEPELPLNVLLISVDTLRADHMGCYGYDRPTTPHIDELARESIVFEDAHATSSWTLPSLASLMTGLYPESHGCVNTSTVLDPGFPTLAEAFRDEGYFTAGIVTQAFASRRFGLDRGFVHFDDDLAESARGRELFKKSSADLSRKATQWLEARAGEPEPRPWFLWLHYFDPHMAYVPHPGISEEFGTERELDLYDGEIAWTDACVGEVLDSLQRLQFDANTLIVFTSDHGEEFEDHGGLYHRSTLYREVLHIPMIVHVPDTPPARRSDLASLLDVGPTVLGAAECPSTSNPQGRDLLASGAARPEHVFASLERDSKPSLFAAIGDQKWILEGPNVRAFDRASDLNELSPLELDGQTIANRVQALQAQARQLGEWSHLAEGTGPVKLSPDEREALKALGYTDGQ